ncbi:AP-4 complex subunit beta-1 [Podila clonocystis]|nr:AP-4 complex subunit beta-1 [Podila clonocystis]
MASTRDITFKKVVYGFLAQYGRTNEELCILSINTLHQDCADLDPIVRSLALRTLCSLGEIVDKLYSLLRDRDTQVVVNSILALEVILADEGGVVINHNIAAYLISRFKDWTSSQLQVILGILCRYKPQSDNEIYEIMNDVDDGLQNSSLAVQISTLRLFIWLCQDLNEIQDEVRKSVEETLIKHLESPVPDLVLASLYHFTLFFKHNGSLKNEDMQYIAPILCRPNDAIAIKIKKVDISSAIATTATPPMSTFVLDHLCHLAVMKDAHDLQKSSKGKLNRQLLAGYQKVAHRSIAAIGYVGYRYRQAQLQLQRDKESHETKALGLLLLRHLDQDELDRIAKKKKKPLRFLYDNDLHGLGQGSTGSSTSLDSSTMLSSQLLQQQEELQSGSLSRLARMSGIRLLLLEESFQQCLLQKQISSLKDSSPVADPSVSNDKKLESAEAALAMRAQYTMLLQQQVQDLAQSIRPARADHLGGRAEQLSLLYLACHLVAFSIEHGEDSVAQDLDVASSIYLQRLEILARVVDQLTPEEVEIRKSELVDNQTKTESRTVVMGVSRDVADRARLINAMFLNPLVASAGVMDRAPGSPLVARQALDGASRRRLDSPLFKTEQYLQMVKPKFVAQFGLKGVSPANNTLSFSSGSAPEQSATINLQEAERQDWLFQVGFNTLAMALA